MNTIFRDESKNGSNRVDLANGIILTKYKSQNTFQCSVMIKLYPVRPPLTKVRKPFGDETISVFIFTDYCIVAIADSRVKRRKLDGRAAARAATGGATCRPFTRSSPSGCRSSSSTGRS